MIEEIIWKWIVNGLYMANGLLYNHIISISMISWIITMDISCVNPLNFLFGNLHNDVTFSICEVTNIGVFNAAGAAATASRPPKSRSRAAWKNGIF